MSMSEMGEGEKLLAGVEESLGSSPDGITALVPTELLHGLKAMLVSAGAEGDAGGGEVVQREPQWSSRAEQDALTPEQVAALTIMLDHYRDDPRTECLRSLVYATPKEGTRRMSAPSPQAPSQSSRPNAGRFGAARTAPAAGGAQVVAGWLIRRNDDQSLTITGPSGEGVVVHRVTIGPREIPEEVLYALASDLLRTPTSAPPDEHGETLGQAPPQGTTDASATNRVDHGGCPSDLRQLIQRMSDEAAECDLYGITKPAAILREAAEALQHAANMQAMDEFGDVVTAGRLREAEPLTLDQIGALDAGCGHGVLHWDTRVSLVRATERAHGIGHQKLPLMPDEESKPAEPVHPDDAAVDQFAALLKAKLAKARAKGRSGWSDPAWSAADINRQLHEHAAKGDPMDVGAYAMFLALRGERTTGPQTAHREASTTTESRRN